MTHSERPALHAGHTGHPHCVAIARGQGNAACPKYACTDYELRIRRVGKNVAVVALLAWLVVEVNGTSTEGNYRYTRVWARDKDKQWKVVGGHVSEIPRATG